MDSIITVSVCSLIMAGVSLGILLGYIAATIDMKRREKPKKELNTHVENSEMGEWKSSYPIDIVQPVEYQCSKCGQYNYKKKKECPYCHTQMKGVL